MDFGGGREEVCARPHAVEAGGGTIHSTYERSALLGVVVEPEHSLDVIEELGLLTSRCVRPIQSLS